MKKLVSGLLFLLTVCAACPSTQDAPPPEQPKTEKTTNKPRDEWREHLRRQEAEMDREILKTRLWGAGETELYSLQTEALVRGLWNEWRERELVILGRKYTEFEKRIDPILIEVDHNRAHQLFDYLRQQIAESNLSDEQKIKLNAKIDHEESFFAPKDDQTGESN